MNFNPLKTLTLVALLLLALVPTTLEAQKKPATNVDASGIAVKGYDVVSYVLDNKPTKGSDKYTATHEGATYHFASADHRDKFKADPTAYVPQYGGWCAWAIAEKKGKVDIDPTRFKVTNGKLFLFYNGALGDVIKLWLKEEARLYPAAEANWPTYKNN